MFAFLMVLAFAIAFAAILAAHFVQSLSVQNILQYAWMIAIGTTPVLLVYGDDLAWIFVYGVGVLLVEYVVLVLLSRPKHGQLPQ